MHTLIESPKSEIKIQMKRLKIQTPAIVVLMAQHRMFRNFMNLILALMPNVHFTHMICTGVTKIYKKFRGH
jgi:hypothetical protein